MAAKDVLYRDQAILSEEDLAELNRRIDILHELTYNSRIARENHVTVTVTYYEPCSDENHEDFGLRGQYKTLTGICRNVDAEVKKTILIGDARIQLKNVRRIDGPENLFREDIPWEVI